MNIKLVVDCAEVDMNDFVQTILSNTLLGAVSSLREVTKDWKEIEIRLTK